MPPPLTPVEVVEDCDTCLPSVRLGTRATGEGPGVLGGGEEEEVRRMIQVTVPHIPGNTTGGQEGDEQGEDDASNNTCPLAIGSVLPLCQVT